MEDQTSRSNFAVVYRANSTWTDPKAGTRFNRYCFQLSTQAVAGPTQTSCDQQKSVCCRDPQQDTNYKLSLISLVVGE